MSLGAAILRWVGRHLLSLTLIVAALLLLPPAVRWISAQAEVAAEVPKQQEAHREALERFDRYALERRRAAEAEAERLKAAPAEALRARRAAIPQLLRQQEGLRLSSTRLALAGARGDSDAVFGHYRAGAEIALLEREARAIDALLAAQASAGRRQAQVARAQASYRAWAAARDRVAQLNGRFLAGARNAVCRETAATVGCEHYLALVEAERQRDEAARINREARTAIAAIEGAAKASAAANAAGDDAAAALDRERARIASEMEALTRAAGKNWLLWIQGPILEVLPTALLILLVAILSPALIKAFLYFVVAPAASRRAAIRLDASVTGRIEERGCSAVSQQVAIGPGEELLVLPEALQSSPHHAEKRTKWLLNWALPLSSLAAGMVGLVRLRVARPDNAAVFAMGDPLAEITLVQLPRGASLVLRPRALIGLIQPVDEPTRISRRWRLGHLSAWLTLQLRYLVFHGPCVLIVQGTRGVRVARAGDGRGTNQANTLGFEAGLRYGVSRSEAFGPYLMGRQELFNDSFEGYGYYLYEELPLDRRKGGLWGRGLRGLGDALLKVFGL